MAWHRAPNENEEKNVATIEETDGQQEPSRRDFLYIATGTVGAVGVAGAGVTYETCKRRGGDEDFCKGLAAAAGVMVGIIARDVIGRQLSEEDNETRNVEIDDATRTGQAQTYETEDGAVGRIEPTNAYTNAKGDQCRSSRETIQLGGQQQEVIHNRVVDSDGQTYIDE